MPNQWWMLGIVIALLSGGLVWYGHDKYEEGMAACQSAQLVAQKKQTTKVKNDYAQIDKKTPFGADKPVAIEWLRLYTRSTLPLSGI